MIKKLGTWFILLTLVIQLLPTSGGINTATAATGNFTFPSESDVISSPRITADERITLTGTINNVDPASISYNVYQITDPSDETKYTNSRENLTSNIAVSGSGNSNFQYSIIPWA